MSRRRAETEPTRGRVCCYCGGELDDVRPVYLVEVNDHNLVGPFHPGCADRIKLRGKHLKPGERLAGQAFGRVLEGLWQEELEL